MSIIEQYNNELYHYGVKGMKWGVRRYQNVDGSITPAGQKRLYNTLNKYAKAKDRRKMLGTGVKEDENLAKAARKVKDAAKNHALSIQKQTELENIHFNTTDPKTRKETYKKYKAAAEESDKLYKEYRDSTKKLANEYLGKYADMPLKNAKHVTAGEAFCMQVEWGIGMGWVNGDPEDN